MSTVRNFFILVVIFVLFGWGMVSFYNASIDISQFLSDDSRSYVFELNVTPIILLIIVGGIVTYISYSKKQKKGWAKSLLLPEEFEESDEREKQITSRACRAAYISMYYAFPIIISLLLIYPFINNTMPYYPILLFLLLPIIQITTYFISWTLNYKS
ncbi:hypothetical protein [Evansella cellulosilytica]|uniref:Putative integral inner membrane protein n=1 Tax=Evansella cellulosilytica (strain ATCC 21833 / DSM 2522 / FERM P-1141 / JCM 9156 / N-4) TaxID=649639 RepID=E6U0U5_EVAC2|nr:hypothetical protein [Evansella cellulosilytica]ADU29143.1 putative integral inner membrane protein [Evansella cellulosilytica DSM 2522]